MGPLKDVKQMWVACWDTPARKNAVFTAPLTRSRWTLCFSPRFPKVGQSGTKKKKKQTLVGEHALDYNMRYIRQRCVCTTDEMSLILSTYMNTAHTDLVTSESKLLYCYSACLCVDLFRFRFKGCVPGSVGSAGSAGAPS